MDLVKFIDAHGGWLGAFRSYQVKPLASPPSEQRLQQPEEEQCDVGISTGSEADPGTW